jgi:hypothetical protein
MFGRKVGTSLLRLPLNARLPFRPAALQSQNAVIALSQRCYATPGRPRGTVGEPSRTVKRAAKKPPAPSKDKAAKQTKAKKKVAAAKKAKAKARPKKRTRKELTEEQQAAASARLAKAKIADLKKAALNPPKARTVTAYMMFTKEKYSSSRDTSFADSVRSVAQEYKALSPAELEVGYSHCSFCSRYYILTLCLALQPPRTHRDRSSARGVQKLGGIAHS